MDDLKMVRDLYGEVPPAPQLEDKIRGRLAALGMERGDGRATGRLRMGFGLGLVATAAAAAVGVATLGSTSPAGQGNPAQGKPVELSAQSILLTAADKAAAEPVGRYWRLDVMAGQSYHVGPVNGGYTVVAYPREDVQWMARSESEPDVFYTGLNAGDAGAHPLTAADKAAWKKAGSPSTWRVWSNDHYATLSMAPGATTGAPSAGWISHEIPPAAKKKKNVEEMKHASDPARLRELMSAYGTLHKASDADNRLTQGFGFLTRQPAPPEVRAAAFQLLATVPGVRSIGTVQDATGRTGIGLAARDTAPDGTTFDEVIVLDQTTFRILGEQHVVVKPDGSSRGMRPGTILDNEVVLQVGWTNENPHHP